MASLSDTAPETPVQIKDEDQVPIKVEDFEDDGPITIEDDAPDPFEAEAKAIETVVVTEGCEGTWMRQYVARNISFLGIQSRRLKRVPPETPENLRRFAHARIHLAWMYNNLQISPYLVEKTHIPRFLDFIVKEPDMHFPDDIVDKATALYKKWENENWGSDEVIEIKEGGGVNKEAGPAEEEQAGSTQAIATQQVALPARNDPMFGPNGMMHGVLVARSDKTGIRVYILNPEVPRVSARVFGHNGIQVGTWYPLQIAALARGAHGSKMGGIYGTLSEGAYSIVAAQTYHDLDRDEGEVLYYSGSNSHANADASRPVESSAGTKALKISLATRKPVRVLRSGGAVSAKHTNRFAPSSGVRYDGLYEVVQMLTPKNVRGGMYEQFKLVRLGGQPSLDQIRRTVPTHHQIAALENLQSRK